MTNAASSRWPQYPYKGLSAYGPEDAPLFAGRTTDVESCADVLAGRSARIMMLHGVTGCGKTSFLRAGLIPYLERDPLRFEFIKDKSEANYKALFIRSTDNPLTMIAQALYQFASEDISVNTFLGKETLNLSRAISEFRGSKDFLKSVNDGPNVLVKVLSDISTIMPKTLVLIVDQAEELLTLNQELEGELLRKRFFEFLALLSRSRIDLKLMFAFRTEFYGRFISEYGWSSIQSRNTQHYLLEELTEAQLLEAIVRPTSQRDIPGYGRPFDQYGFSFEPGLPEKIIEDLKATRTARAKLSLLQITCWNLYRRVTATVDGKLITMDDYNSLGGTEGQLEENVNDALTVVWNQQEKSRIRLHSRDKEIGRWKDVLSSLVKEQVDGTVTTEIVSKERLNQTAHRADCIMPFQDVADYLSRDEIRLLRPVTVVDFKGKEISAYSLGHDAVGLALRVWSEGSKQERDEARRWRLRLLIPAILLGLVSGYLGLLGVPRPMWIAGLAISALLIMVAYSRAAFLVLVSAPYVVFSKLPTYLSRRVTRTPTSESSDDIFGSGKALENMSFLFYAILPMIVGLVGFVQTDAFASLLSRPSDAQIRVSMRESQAIQDEIARRSSINPPSRAIEFQLFDEAQVTALQNATSFILVDDSLQRELQLAFGRSLRDVTAVVVPSWRINSGNLDLLGITNEGWQSIQTKRSGGLDLLQTSLTDVGGYTLRERPHTPAVTLDGRPRIVLNLSAFESAAKLRLVLFHELLHAMNIPGYQPPWYAFAHNDLTYLPLYRDYVRRSGFRRFDEYMVWILAVITPWIASLMGIRHLIRLRRRRKTGRAQRDYLSLR